MTADTALELLADLAPVRDDELAGAAPNRRRPRPA